MGLFDCFPFTGLIVAVLDHEHFRLKMIYMEKKIATAEVVRYKDLEKRWEVSQCAVKQSPMQLSLLCDRHNFHLRVVETKQSV